MPRDNKKDLVEKVKKTKAKPDGDELDDSILSQSQAASPAPTRVTEKKSSTSQSTIDKMLKAVPKDSLENLQQTLKSFEKKLSNMASQEYLETKFKKTEDTLIERLDSVKVEIQQQIQKEVETIQQQMTDMQSNVEGMQLKQVENSTKISDLETKVEHLKIENIRLTADNEKLFDLFNQRDDVLKQQDNRLNNLEQYSRRNSVRIYGIDDRNPKETSHETSEIVANILKSKLNVDVDIQDIDVAHRTGRFLKDGNRPIICKFVTRLKKFEVIKRRRNLKGTAVVIKEDLTLINVKRINEASKVENVTKVWSDDGKIIALLDTDEKILIDYKTDLTKPLAVPKKKQHRQTDGEKEATDRQNDGESEVLEALDLLPV